MRSLFSLALLAGASLIALWPGGSAMAAKEGESEPPAKLLLAPAVGTELLYEVRTVVPKEGEEKGTETAVRYTLYFCHVDKEELKIAVRIRMPPGEEETGRYIATVDRAGRIRSLIPAIENAELPRKTVPAKVRLLRAHLKLLLGAGLHEQAFRNGDGTKLELDGEAAVRLRFLGCEETTGGRNACFVVLPKVLPDPDAGIETEPTRGRAEFGMVDGLLVALELGSDAIEGVKSLSILRLSENLPITGYDDTGPPTAGKDPRDF